MINLKALAELREKKGLRQKDIAFALGYKTGDAYTRIEKGNRKLHAEALPIIAAKLGISVVELSSKIFLDVKLTDCHLSNDMKDNKSA